MAMLFAAPEASAQVLGPRVELPLDWVWTYSSSYNAYTQVSRIRELAIASNGTDFLVTWRQVGPLTGVVGPSGEEPMTSRAGVFGVRVSASGALLDAAPIVISLEPVADAGDYGWTFPGNWVGYAAASDTYLAAWPCTGGLCAARVTSAGAVLDATPIALGGATGPAAVLSDGDRHYVLAGSQMFAVASDGTVTPHPLAFALGAVATDGTHLLNVAGSDITLAGMDGAVLATATLPVEMPSAAVTFDGTDFVIVGTGPYSMTSKRYLTRVSTSGTVLGTAVELGSALIYDSGYDAAFDGLNEVVASCFAPHDDTTFGTLLLVDESGTPPVGNVLASLGCIKTVSIASNGAGTSAVVADGFRFTPYTPRTYHPYVQVLTAWTPAPTITVPETIRVTATRATGAVVSYTASAHDGAGGDLVPSCDPPSGALFAPGVTEVTCTATDAAGNSASASFQVVVTFGWSGILPPVNPAGSSVFKLGRTVPIKFMLAGASAGIPDLDAVLWLAKLHDGIAGTEEPADSTAAATTGNRFRYDAESGQYVFNLATRDLTPGTWQARIDLGDGVLRAVQFSLRP